MGIEDLGQAKRVVVSLSLIHIFSLPMYHEVKIGLPSADRFRSRWMKKRPDVVYVATESPMGASAVKAARAQMCIRDSR